MASLTVSVPIRFLLSPSKNSASIASYFAPINNYCLLNHKSRLMIATIREVSDDMNCKWIKQCRMVSVMLSLLLVCLFANSALASQSSSHSSTQQPPLTQTIQVHLHPAPIEPSDPSHYFHIEQREPAKSLSPSLASILRNGSFTPERLHEAEPTYELVFDFADTTPNTLVWRVFLTLDAWFDWTLHPPSTMHRIAGWKESNILYRFISQADA